MLLSQHEMAYLLLTIAVPYPGNDTNPNKLFLSSHWFSSWRIFQIEQPLLLSNTWTVFDLAMDVH